MPSKTPKILVLKMVTGECLISEVKMRGKKATLIHPMVVLTEASLPEEMSGKDDEENDDEMEVDPSLDWILQRWIDGSVDTEFTVEKTAILTTCTAEPSLLRFYLSVRMAEDTIFPEEYLEHLGKEMLDPKTRQKIIDELPDIKGKKETKDDSGEDDFFFEGKPRFGIF